MKAVIAAAFKGRNGVRVDGITATLEWERQS
jgi:hypothetical protein